MADSFLARELLTETSDEMWRHLETCPACRAELAAQRALRQALRRAFRNAGELSPTPEFTTRLQMRLEKAARQEPARRGIRFDRRSVLAAIVVFAVALGLAYRGRNRVTPPRRVRRGDAGRA